MLSSTEKHRLTQDCSEMLLHIAAAVLKCAACLLGIAGMAAIAS